MRNIFKTTVKPFIQLKSKKSLRILKPFLKNLSEIGQIRDKFVHFYEKVDWIIKKVRARLIYYDAKLEVLNTKWDHMRYNLSKIKKDKKVKELVKAVFGVSEEVRNNILR